MTRLVWGQIADRRYEAGVSRGVLFPPTGPGVVWNGLMSVVESHVGKGTTPLYSDGIKYLDEVSSSDYAAKVTAITIPEILETFIGYASAKPGIILTRQAKTMFGFAYRTEIAELGYKIHLVYNVTANISTRAYGTVSNTPNPVNYDFMFDAIPVPSDTHKPSAHLIVDSTKTTTEKMATFENYIYGDGDADPMLPSMADLITFFNS